MLRFNWILTALSVLGLAAALSNEAAAQVQDWPLLFDTTVVPHLNLTTLAAGDVNCVGPEDPTTWAEIQQDLTALVEHPALFWADGEEVSKLCVTLRHKGGNSGLGDPSDPKVALKIDINELVPGQRWHGVRKISLEEGGDKDPATEGIAWMLERLAADHATTAADFTPGLASWATVAVNGTEYGIYTNLEQKDKSFLQNRGIYDSSSTWLYKVENMQVSPFGSHSPTQVALCYPPFNNTCSTPDDATLETELNALIDMDVMLTQGAVETFIVAPDNFFSKIVNYWHADFAAPQTLKRRYITDDLDTTMGTAIWDIYGADQQQGKTDIQNIILGHPTFGPQYDLTLCKLLAGPFEASALAQMVTDVETAITPALLSDPNNNIGTSPAQVATHFDNIRQFMVDRTADINSQLVCPATCTAHVDCNDGNVCTDDACDFGSGFCNNPSNTASCDDGLSCTTADMCSAGVCGGTDTCAVGAICEPNIGACVSEIVAGNLSDAMSGANVTSLLINTPAGTIQDDLLIAVVTTDGNQSASLSPPAGQGWTALDVSAQGSAVTLGAWWKLADASEPASHTWTWGGNEEAYGYMTRITGHDTANPIEASATGGGTSANPTAPALIVGTPGALILRIGGFDDNDITIGDAGMADHITITMNESGGGNNNASSGAAHTLRGPSSSVSSADFTLTASEQWRTVTLAITPAPLAAGCGNGILDPGEDCDEGVNNGTVGSCCGESCSFELVGTVCGAVMDACDAPEFCTGSSAVCPPDLLVDCDDGNACTADSCDEISGCFNDPIPGCGVFVPSSTPTVQMLISLILLVAGGVLVAQRRQGFEA